MAYFPHIPATYNLTAANRAQFFRDGCAQGDRSRDILGYNRQTRSLQIQPYPLYATADGNCMILPTGLREWLRRRPVIWECLCAHYTAEPCPIKLRIGPESRHVFGFCTHLDSKCGWLQNYSEIYDRFPPTGSNYKRIPCLPVSDRLGFAARIAPMPWARDTICLKQRRRRGGGGGSDSTALIRPLKRARVSEHATQATRICSLPTIVLSTNTKSQDSVIVLDSSSIVIGSPSATSSMFSDPIDIPNLVPSEYAAAMDNARQGLEGYEWEALISGVEQCDGEGCGKYFTEKALREHIPQCAKNKGKGRARGL